jgi:hypothetical protein
LRVNYRLSEIDYADAADQAVLSSLLQESSKFTGGVCYSMTKSLTLLGDGSSVDTRARHDTIFVTGSYSRSWALDALQPAAGQGMSVWRRLRLGKGRPNVLQANWSNGSR